MSPCKTVACIAVDGVEPSVVLMPPGRLVRMCETKAFVAIRPLSADMEKPPRRTAIRTYDYAPMSATVGAAVYVTVTLCPGSSANAPAISPVVTPYCVMLVTVPPDT